MRLTLPRVVGLRQNRPLGLRHQVGQLDGHPQEASEPAHGEKVARTPESGRERQPRSPGERAPTERHPNAPETKEPRYNDPPSRSLALRKTENFGCCGGTFLVPDKIFTKNRQRQRQRLRSAQALQPGRHPGGRRGWHEPSLVYFLDLQGLPFPRGRGWRGKRVLPAWVLGLPLLGLTLLLEPLHLQHKVGRHVEGAVGCLVANGALSRSRVLLQRAVLAKVVLAPARRRGRRATESASRSELAGMGLVVSLTTSRVHLSLALRV